MDNKTKKQKRITTFQIIIMSFIGMIILGTLILMLPISTADGQGAGIYDAIFTATSAVCVTGLVVQNTATYWSLFGKIIIIILIQIGGMGAITIFAEVSILFGKKIGLKERGVIQDALSLHNIGGAAKFITFVVKSVVIIEIIGAVLLTIVFHFTDGMPVLKSIGYGIFHSISAFCNAGFDLCGEEIPYNSLVAYGSNVPMNIVIMFLIIAGGLGFITYNDIKSNGIHFRKYKMQSKVIIVTSLVLIIVPAVLFGTFEFSEYPMKSRILLAIFQSVTTRTAGFNTVDFNEMSEAGIAIMIFLMLIGGSPGSTAGGYKTTTIAVLVASAIAVFSRKDDTHFFGRRIDDKVVKNAVAIVLLYFTSFFVAGLLISKIEALPLMTCLFETGSAAGTVGLTMGITPTLSLASRAILVFQMFWGRVGGLTLIFAASPIGVNTEAKLPREDLMVG